MFCITQPVLDLAACLTSLGFAHVVDIPKQMSSEPAIAKYHQHLKHVQDRAKRNRNGVWSDKYFQPFFGIKFIFSNVVYVLLC